VIAQAAGLAVLAAISPTALLLAAVYLGSARPRATILCYLAGALLMSIAIGVVILVALREGGFSLPHHRHDRYGLRLGLGILLVLAGLVVFRRKPKPVDPDKPQKGIVGRLMANPAPYSAFLAGLLVFGPGVTFIAAVQVVATANADLSETAVALIVVVVINVALVWLPLLAYLAAPDLTGRRLMAFNGWLRSHGRIILASVLVIAGIILTVNGITGLIQKG
jgi:hypothetical protein